MVTTPPAIAIAMQARRNGVRQRGAGDESPVRIRFDSMDNPPSG
jgi:hypothetical protein